MNLVGARVIGEHDDCQLPDIVSATTRLLRDQFTSRVHDPAIGNEGRHAMPIAQSRRRFLTNVAFAGAAGLGGARVVGLGNSRKSLAAEPPPETTKLRL